MSSASLDYVTVGFKLRFEQHFPYCQSRLEDTDTVYFWKNDTEWFKVKFTVCNYVRSGYQMALTGPKPETLDTEAYVGYSGGTTLFFSHMEEEKYVLRLVQKYFIQCGYVSDGDDEDMY